MIKLEHVVLASPEQMEFIIEGMRNSMNSREKSDSGLYCPDKYNGYIEPIKWKLGENDHDLMQRLASAGTDDRKFMRMMPVYVRITAPLYWWEDFDNSFGEDAVANSCSTMHKIAEKEFTLEDFSYENLDMDGREVLEDTINVMNKSRAYFNENKAKNNWRQMIQLLPSSYNQTRNVMMNYEVLANIYKSRKNHKLDCWRELCSWIESLPYSELICGDDALMSPNELREKIGLEPIKEPSESLKMVEVGKAVVTGIQEGWKNFNPDKDSCRLSPNQISTMNKAIKDRDDFDRFLSGK